MTALLAALASALLTAVFVLLTLWYRQAGDRRSRAWLGVTHTPSAEWFALVAPPAASALFLVIALLCLSAALAPGALGLQIVLAGLLVLVVLVASLSFATSMRLPRWFLPRIARGPNACWSTRR